MGEGEGEGGGGKGLGHSPYITSKALQQPPHIINATRIRAGCDKSVRWEQDSPSWIPRLDAH